MRVPPHMTTAPGNDDHNGNGSPNGSRRPAYDCSQCPGYCCSYEKIEVGKRDLERLARHFGIGTDAAGERFTKIIDGEPVLRHQKDDVYATVCIFFDRAERRCSVYESRPAVCREYPDGPRCGYYDFLRWERRHQDDVDFVPLRKG